MHDERYYNLARIGNNSVWKGKKGLLKATKLRRNPIENEAISGWWTKIWYQNNFKFFTVIF